MSLSDKLAIVGLLISFLSVTATVTGFLFVARQINLARGVAKADFIVRLEQKFADFAPTYSKFQPDKEWSPEMQGPSKDDYTEVVTYLDFLATFPLLMKEGIIDFETFDGMFGHRFFITLNNPHIKVLLLYYKESWTNLLSLYKDWKQFRMHRDRPIVQPEHAWDEKEPLVLSGDTPPWFPLQPGFSDRIQAPASERRKEPRGESGGDA